MAFTKSPTQDSHNVQRVEIGGENFLTSDGLVVPTGGTGPATTLNFIDCFPLFEKMGAKDKPKYRVSKRVPWISETFSVTSAVTAGLQGNKMVPSITDGQLYLHFALGSTYYTMNTTPEPATVAAVVAGTATLAYKCGPTIAINNSNAVKVCALDSSSNFYTWNEDGTGLTTTSLAGIGVTGLRNLVFIDGYLFAATRTKIYNSAAGGVLTTWNSTDFLSAEIYPDEIIWIDKYKNYLVAFGQSSTEFFYDAAVEVGSPLARQETYATKIGLVLSERMKNTATIGDDMYFIGKTLSDTLALYRIRDFKIEVIDNQYFNGFLNTQPSGTSEVTYFSIDNYMINNNSVIGITMKTEDDDVSSGSPYYVTLIYDPFTELFWNLSTSGTYATLNTDLPYPNEMIGSTIFMDWSSPSRPLIFTIPLVGTQIFRSTEQVGTKTYAVTSNVFTNVIDFDNNRYKHLARVDAIGDFDDNTLTLSYNPSANYNQTYVACSPTYNAATIGYDANISWYNLGAFRRWSFKFTMAGYGTGFLEGFDVEYNMGIA